MPRCSFCSKLTVELLRDNDVVFHDSLAALAASAAQGCDFCRLCWTQIPRELPAESIEALLANKDDDPTIESQDGARVDRRIWLRGGIFDLHARAGYRGTTRNSIWISVGMLPWAPDTTTGTSGLNTHVDVFADPDTPAALLFRERYSTSSRNPEHCVAFGTYWARQCLKNHPACREDSTHQMPTRLLDVGTPQSSGNTRLVLSVGLAEPQPYVALSYCWGVGVRHSLELRAVTFDILVNGVHEDALSRSHREAIDLTRSLGFQYLWIDSLCIIQGDQADWERESKLMASVYGNAVLTIVAGRSADSQLGFVTNPLKQPVDPVEIPYEDLDDKGRPQGSIFAALPRKTDTGPVDARGWCFQESQLSARILRFCTEQVAFQCRKLTVWEDGTYLDATVTDQRSSWPATRADDPKPEVLRRWYRMVQQFSARQLTEPHDVFAAIASLAQLAHRATQSRYIAGLWESDIVRGLLWRPSYHMQGWDTRVVKRPLATGWRAGEAAGQVTVRAPTWSWAAVQGPVSWRVMKSHDAQYCDSTSHRVRPSREDGLWTDQPGCEPDLLYMPSCSLEMYGQPRRVRLFASAAADHPKASQLKLGRTGWRAKRAVRWTERPEKFFVLLEALEAECTAPSLWQDGELNSAVAVGAFDFADERHSAKLWCMKLIKSEGLILERDREGHFRRLGWFLSENDEFFDAADEVAVSLV